MNKYSPKEEVGALTDEEVVYLAIKDKEKFALLMERYADKLMRYLARLGVSVYEDREDIFQDSFLNAYRHLSSFDLTLSFSSWIYRIVHNEAMSFFRRKKSRPEVILGIESDLFLFALRDENADTAAATERRLSAHELSLALAEISQKYRDILVLRFFEERSYGEISDILKIPVGTVSTMIHRARRSLRLYLGDRLQ